jgi:hypothetical protein
MTKKQKYIGKLVVLGLIECFIVALYAFCLYTVFSKAYPGSYITNFLCSVCIAVLMERPIEAITAYIKKSLKEE